MKLKFLTSLIGTGVLLLGTSAFGALTDAQKAAITAKINAASTPEVAPVAAQALKGTSLKSDIAFVVNAAKARLGPTASVAVVRNLVNALVTAAPNQAPAIVSAAGGAFPEFKANIAAAAQTALASAVANGAISQAQANALSYSANLVASIAGVSELSIFDGNPEAVPLFQPVQPQAISYNYAGPGKKGNPNLRSGKQKSIDAAQKAEAKAKELARLARDYANAAQKAADKVKQEAGVNKGDAAAQKAADAAQKGADAAKSAAEAAQKAAKAATDAVTAANDAKGTRATETAEAAAADAVNAKAKAETAKNEAAAAFNAQNEMLNAR